MSRLNYGAGNWPVNGPRVLAWLRAEVPQRRTLVGMLPECARALRLPCDHRRLGDYLSDTQRDEWRGIKRTLGTGIGPRAVTAAPAASSPAAGGPSLTEFVAAKKRAACPVCRLPTDVLACLATAPDKGIRIDEQVEWLNVGRGFTVTRDELLTHRNQRHQP